MPEPIPNSAKANRDPHCGSELARDFRPRPPRGYSALRHHRWSAAGATYFVTACTTARKTTLLSPAILAALQQERAAMEADGTWQVDSEVIMPDHLHYLFELGPRLSLGRTIARLKGKTASVLQAAGLTWQAGYFDHRLRDTEAMLPILRYILLNPVRAGLIDRGESWPGYHCSSTVWDWFKAYAHEAVVEPAWLSAAERVK